VLVSAAFVSLQSQDAPDSVSRTKIVALESAWNQAEEKGDIQALNLIFDDSMKYIDEDGSLLTKAQFIANAQAAGAHLHSLAMQEMSVRVYGETAQVEGSYPATGVGRRKRHRGGHFIDTWAFKNGTWVCVVAQATPILR
jgi:hypothetical protein